jgi:pyridoxamine 5'-phosphate oxidase family protein
MNVFSDAELTYLTEGRLGRLATVDGAGMPHVVPLGWRYNPELDAIDIGGRDFARSRKFHNVQRNPKVALVIDDVLPPWRPRCVLIRGMAEALADATGPDGDPAGPIIRLLPTEVISWGMESAGEYRAKPSRLRGGPSRAPVSQRALTPRQYRPAKPAPAAAEADIHPGSGDA